MQNFLRTSFNGDQNLGLYGLATDKYALVGVPGVAKKIRATLGVPVYFLPILNTNLAGIFVAGNSHGIIISKHLRDYGDVHRLKQHFDSILVLKTKYTALGNLVLMNDNGAIISPLLKKNKAEIRRETGINCEISTIAKQRMTGSLGLATNKGCLLHPKARKHEQRIIEDILGVSSDIGTVNFGSPYPRSGMLANSSGVVVSERTSGPELGRIAEVFGFV
jgi:translation initiation factor 6